MGDRFASRSLAAVAATVLALAVLSGCGSTEKKSGTSDGATAATSSSGSVDGGGTGNSGETGKTGESDGDSGSKSGDSEATTQAPEPPPIQILGGNEMGIHVNEPTIIIASTRKEFNKLKKDLFSGGVEKRPVSSASFPARQIVGVFLPLQRPGVLVQITSVDERGGKIIVGAVRLLPGKGCKTASRKSRPFHLVETRRMRGAPTLKLEDLNSTAC